MPVLLPILLTVSHVLLAADTVPKFDVERTCRPAAASGLQGELLQRASMMETMHDQARARVDPVQCSTASQSVRAF